tara:strand:+ start:737 stop:1603 length:867 start_codon:yes stop_codon:yes gene_type:complete
MELRVVVIFIVLLSFVGIYINIYKRPILKDPELFKLPAMFRTNLREKESLDLNDMSVDDLASRIIKEKEGNNTLYSSIGNVISEKNGYINEGMQPGVVTTDIDSSNLSSVGNKRPYAWHGASSQREWPDNKTVNAGLSYNVYHQLDKESLKNITSSDRGENVTKMAGPKIKNSAGEQTIGVFMGKDKTYDELENKQSEKEINQALAILRNAVANEGKQLFSIDTVDRIKTGERYGTRNNNSIPRYTNIKVKPNVNTSMTEKDVANIVSKDIKIDPVGDLIKQTSEFIK